MKANFCSRSTRCTRPGRQRVGLRSLGWPVVLPIRASGHLRVGGSAGAASARCLDRDGSMRETLHTEIALEAPRHPARFAPDALLERTGFEF